MLFKTSDPNFPVILLIFGYALFAPFLFFLDTSSVASAVIRCAILLPCAYCILKKGAKLSFASLLWLAFLLLILYKLFDEATVKNSIPDEFFYTYLVSTFAPAILISFVKLESSSLGLVKYRYIFLAILCLHIINSILFIFNDLGQSFGRFGYPQFNPNSMGIFALVTLVLLSEKKSFFLYKVISFMVMLIANSRQTFIAFMFFLVSRYRLASFRLSILFGGIVFLMLYIFLIAGTEFDVLGRMMAIFSSTEESVTLRKTGYLIAIQSIGDKPLFGGSLSNGIGGFAHNVFLEIAQGFGLLSVFVFTFVLIVSLLAIKRRNKSEYQIATIYLISALFSGAIYSNSELLLWMTYGIKFLRWK